MKTDRDPRLTDMLESASMAVANAFFQSGSPTVAIGGAWLHGFFVASFLASVDRESVLEIISLIQTDESLSIAYESAGLEEFVSELLRPAARESFADQLNSARVRIRASKKYDA